MYYRKLWWLNLTVKSFMAGSNLRITFRWSMRRRRSQGGRWSELSGRSSWTCYFLLLRNTSTTTLRTWWTSLNNLWWALCQQTHIGEKHNTPAHYPPCFVKFVQIAHSMTFMLVHTICCGWDLGQHALTLSHTHRNMDESIQYSGLVPARGEQQCVGADETSRSSSRWLRPIA